MATRRLSELQPFEELEPERADTLAAHQTGWNSDSLTPKQRRAQVELTVLRAVQDLTLATKSTSFIADTTLMEVGVDSLSATELATRLRSLTGVRLSSTIVFEQPTPRAITAHLLEQLGDACADAVLTQPTATRVATAGAPLALLALVGRWPGGCNGEAARWALQMACGDAVGSVPHSRWVLETMVDVGDLSAEMTASVGHGGFVSGAQRFDISAFSISPAEAGAMDPQQRMLLELGYASLHGSVQRRATLMGSDTGVFLGIERPDWAFAQPPSARTSIYVGTGDNVAVAAGRLSFTLGLQGPCMSTDTACSSSLVVVHGGAHTISGGESVLVLALSIGLKLGPYAAIGNAAAGMLSVDGRCKTLDARANGYAKSEGAGALVLTLEGGLDLRLRGSAVKQDGRSASLTAPNGSAQKVLLVAALDRASAEPIDLKSAHLHGTGTALGDPTEAAALAAVHMTVGRAAQLLVDSGKANVAHGDGASGFTHFLRAVQASSGCTSPGNAQLRVANTLISDRFGSPSMTFSMPTQANTLSRMGECATSSFGFSGTIDNTVLQMSPHVEHGSEVALSSASLAESTMLAYKRRAFLWVAHMPALRVKRLLAFGDSLTAGYHICGDEFAPWAPLVGHIRGAEVCDHVSVSEFTSGELVETMDMQAVRDVASRQRAGLRTKMRLGGPYDVVLIMCGTNDLTSDITPEDLVRNVAALHVAAHSLGARTVAMSIPESRYTTTLDEARHRHKECNQALRTWAAAQPSSLVHFVDVSELVPYDADANAAGLWEPDGLHFSAAGYEAFGRALAPAISAFIADEGRGRGTSPSLAPSFEDLQNIASLDADVPFLQAGLSSIGVARFASRLRGEVAFGLEVLPTLIFEQPTVRAMAAHFEASAADNGVALGERLVDRILEVLGGIISPIQGLARMDQPTRVSDCLIRVNPALSDGTNPPLIGAPMLTGTGELFASLARHIMSPLYFFEHPVLYTGKDVPTDELPAHYAVAIRDECILTLWATFDLIGASFGGYLAHRIAFAAKALGFAPRSLILLEPVPLVVESPELIRLEPMSMREAVVALLSLQLAALARLTERDDTVEDVLLSLPKEVAAWAEGEIAIRVTERLAKEGLRKFSVDEAVRVARQLKAWRDSDRMLNRGLAQHCRIPVTPPWKTFLVLASQRVAFFERHAARGMAAASASFANARLYGGDSGDISEEMLVEGRHLAVVPRCGAGEEDTFVHRLRTFLQPEHEGNTQWQLQTLSDTPVLLFEPSDAHKQGRATRIMLHGPPTIDEPLRTPILFILSNERSGSSLLQMCLQCHSELYAGQELHLLPFADLDERSSSLPMEMKAGLHKNVMDLKRCAFEGAYDWVGGLERQAAPTCQTYQRLQELCSPRILVDKTPQNGDHPNFLAHAHAIFGTRASYCHLVRHPYSCISSGLELRRDVCMNANVTWSEVEHAYLTLQRNISAFLAAHAQRRQRRIRYEDLLREPVPVLGSVCMLAGVLFEPGMEAPYESADAVTSFQAASFNATTDPKLFQRKTIEASQAENWRKVRLSQPLRAETAALARGYEYELL